eukprot:4670599-Alexandrium_andersonii.AAC.1
MSVTPPADRAAASRAPAAGPLAAAFTTTSSSLPSSWRSASMAGARPGEEDGARRKWLWGLGPAAGG